MMIIIMIIITTARGILDEQARGKSYHKLFLFMRFVCAVNVIWKPQLQTSNLLR